MYVLEYDADGILNGSDAGALIYLSPDGKTRTTIADDELINPTGLEIGSDGDLYVSNKGFVAGQGEVLRLSLADTPSGWASQYDLVKHCMKSIGAESDLANVYPPQFDYSFSTQSPLAV